jgi:hypothetical protein
MAYVARPGAFGQSLAPNSVGDWIVTSVLIVKGEDFKIVNQPRESKSG